MKIEKLSNMTKGWFIGNFHPTVLDTDDVEVAVKSYKKGDFEERHYHKIATEITVIVKGLVRMNGIKYSEGSIIIIEPNESTDFEALEDTINTVVKYPGASNDKYVGISAI
jgi:quercetin dioxygenase-like cupin family protein